jgi:hypothetical protein
MNNKRIQNLTRGFLTACLLVIPIPSFAWDCLPELLCIQARLGLAPEHIRANCAACLGRDILGALGKCVQAEEEILPKKDILSDDLREKMAEFLQGLRFLEGLGLNPSEPHFESEWLTILKIVFGFGGNTAVVAENFSSGELESIRQYRDKMQQDLNQRTAFSDLATMGPDDGTGIPDKVQQGILEEKLADIESILHMWDPIAALGGLIPGAASAAPPNAQPRRPIPQISGKPPAPSSPPWQTTRPPGSMETTLQPSEGPAAPGRGESLISPAKRSGLGVDLAVQKHSEKAEYRQGSGREVESAHMMPSSALKGVEGYRRGAALTVLLPKEVHRTFDNQWKAWSRKQAAQGIQQVRVHDFLRVLDEAAAAVPELHGRTAETMSWCFRHEVYQTLGLHPTDLLPLPYAK